MLSDYNPYPPHRSGSAGQGCGELQSNQHWAGHMLPTPSLSHDITKSHDLLAGNYCRLFCSLRYMTPGLN